MKDLLERVSTLVQKQSIYSRDKSDTYGEVFTPNEVIANMLSELPEGMWKDKSKTFFDPCVGLGNFPILIIQKLISAQSPPKHLEIDSLRHIVENQIFMAEYQKSSAEFVNTLFTFGKDFKVNLYVGDTLNMPEDFFDLSWEDRRVKYPENCILD
tara:strand:- start:67 stop:531 length:465 start_codon:yes stop_codon:yes gene_type:complete